MPHSITLQPVAVMTGAESEEGRLVFASDRLTAVLVHLSGALYGEQQGGWFLEAGFGPCSSMRPPVFSDLDAATVWVRAQVAR